MNQEQQKTIQIFTDAFQNRKAQKLVIYGTGINAEAIITCCKDFSIAGVMDVAKEGELFCGQKVLTKQQVLDLGVKCIVVVARPAVHCIIYNRIRKWCEENFIEVLDIWGEDIAQKEEQMECSSDYFNVSYEMLRQEIDKHDVISFDIFDTLLMRRVYEPMDVFSLLDLQYSDHFEFIFSQERILAERELLLKGQTTIYEIYELLAKKFLLSEKLRDELLENEIRTERQVLTQRTKMVECFSYCKEMGKPVYLVSDMYLPKAILNGLLAENGIVGYTDCIVSCDYGKSKTDGLFNVLKSKIGQQSCLHIGDNSYCDGEAAQKSGIDSFLIMQGMRMMEISTYRNVLSYVSGIESRVLIGMFSAKVMNNPFILYHSDGRPTIDCLEDFGYLFIAPVTLGFIVWLIKQIREDVKASILFAARDGWLFQKIYQLLVNYYKVKNLPRDYYFYISRSAISKVVDRDTPQVSDAFKRYFDSLAIDLSQNIYFVDFMSRGTCQYKMEQFLSKELQGIYFQRSFLGEIGRDQMKVKPYFKEHNAFEKDLKIFALCDFLECIFTSYDASFLYIDSNGKPVFEQEKRSAEQMQSLHKIHKGIMDFCEEFIKIFPVFPQNYPSPKFGDDILRFISKRYSDIDLPCLQNFELDDPLGGDKNTGMEALM